MGVWAELRRSGAVPLGQATWAVPDLPAARPLLDRLAGLVEAASGSLLVLAARGDGDADADRLTQLYVETRESEWQEFHASAPSTSTSWTRKNGSASTRSRSWRKRSRASIGSDAGSVSFAAVTFSAFLPRSTPRTDLKVCEERFAVYADHVYAAVSDPDA